MRPLDPIERGLDRDTFKALKEDAFRQDFHEVYGPTPKQERDALEQQTRRVISDAFEQGDHLVDGTVSHEVPMPFVTPPCTMPMEGPWPFPTISREQATGLRAWALEQLGVLPKLHE